MPAVPTMYRWDDPGAPDVSSRADALYHVLMACLVTGYGSHAGAGWSVVFDDWASAGVCTFTNRTGSGVLGIVRGDTYNYGSGLFIADAMVDGVTPVVAHSAGGVVSNVATLPQQTQTAHQMMFGYNNEHQYWSCVANDQAFYLMGAVSPSIYSKVQGVGWNDGCSLFVGAFNSVRGLGDLAQARQGNFVMFGGRRSNSYTVIGWPTSFSYGVLSGLLSDKNGAVASSRNSAAPGRGVASSVFAAESVGDVQSVALSPVDVLVSGGVQIGVVPMLLSSYQLAAGSALLADVFQRFLEPVVVAGSPVAVIFIGGTSRLFLSLDPADWQ